MDKRYPKLFVSPECTKVVVNWSRQELRIPFNTPVSFEHDFVQEETPSEHQTASSKTVDHVKLESGTTRWNAKMILMSGLSNNALEELSSERNYEDRIPHLCNMLRFAFLKDGSSFMAIGGSWDTVDGNNPSVDKSTLVQTVSRYAKALTGLDLKNCQHWNPFLEIHYDRIGSDGLFSHKEVTVLYVPDLSGCLPSIDAWRNQWLAHKKAVAERERLHALKREKSREKKEGQKDKESGTPKDVKKDEKSGKKKEAETSGSKSNGKGKTVTKVKGKEVEKEVEKTNAEKKDGVETVDEGNTSAKKIQTEKAAGVQTPGSGKKKIIRKVIKKKVVAEKDGNAPKQDDTADTKNNEETTTNADAIVEDAEPSATPNPSTVKTKKKITKKTPVAKPVKKEDEGTQSEATPVKEPEGSEEKTKTADVASASVKTIVKKKIIKRVTKRKVAVKDKVAKENEAGTTAVEGNLGNEIKSENKEPVKETVPPVTEQQKDLGGGSNETGNKQVKEEKKGKTEGSSVNKVKTENADVSVKNEVKDKKKEKDGKSESKGKEVKDKKKSEEPPRHPGFILQTKGNKNSKLRSMSLSLDSLLDYTDKDIEESTVELSLFAETFYEMLQYQMGSRILTFLQKLRIKFVAKRNQKKRQREEASDKKEKEKTKKSSPKRQKTEDVNAESKSDKTETLQEVKDEKTVVKDEKMVVDDVENTKPEDESEKEEDPDEDEDEDPEEDPEEDEEMEDASPKNEEKDEDEKVDMDVKSENVEEKVKDEEENVKETVNLDKKLQGEEKKENTKVDTKKKETPVIIDKELLQAFRFFDRNRVGYIRVEDLRLMLHSMGKFMSHRDIKELVQSALLESNTGRDDRVLYNKLVKMTDI